MEQTIGEILNQALGLNTQPLSWEQMGLRAIVVYGFGLLIVRLGGDRRFIGKYAPFDAVLGIILGATLSRAINGSAAFFPTLGSAGLLVVLHWVFAELARHSEHFERWAKGTSEVIIRDGRVRPHALSHSHLSTKDVECTLRCKTGITDLSQIEVAYLEASGDISVVRKPNPPQILEVEVEPGVQTVRIQLDS